MVRKIVWVMCVLCCGFASAGERAAQKGDAVQKSAVQKEDAAQKGAYQKGEVQVRVGLFGWRHRSARVCRSGHCG